MSGRTPHELNSRYSATSSANSAGCANAVCSSSADASLCSSAHTTSRNGRASSPSKATNTASSASRNTANVSYSALPICGRWLPCPVNSTASLPPPLLARPTTACADGSPAASACSAPNSPARSGAITTPRSSKCVRVAASECASSPNDSAAVASKCATSRHACACSALPLLADSTNGSAPADNGAADTTPASFPAAASPTGSPAGGSSRITCALVPLTPNDDTAARRRCPLRARGRLCVNSRTVPDDQSTCGDASSACSVLGKTPCPIDSTILMRPAPPAAACV